MGFFFFYNSGVKERKKTDCLITWALVWNMWKKPTEIQKIYVAL